MIEKLIDQSISIDKIIGIDWYQSIDDQSITTQKSFIDWHRLEQDLETDVTHATCPIIHQFWEALGTKLVKQFGPSQRKEYIRCPCTRITHLPIIAFPLRVTMSLRDVWVKALLNIRCIVKGHIIFAILR